MKQKKETKKIDQKRKRDTLYNIEMFQEASNGAINFSDDYSSMVSEENMKQLKEQDLKY